MSHSPSEPSVLSEEQIDRFARQIIVPGVGAEGQLCLCATAVFIDGDPIGSRVASQYLRAAGLTVYTATTPPPDIDCVLLAGMNTLSPTRIRTLVAASRLLAWYEIVGTHIRGGLADGTHPVPGEPRREPFVERAGRSIVAANHIAGADAATTVMAAVLGWITPGHSYELELP